MKLEATDFSVSTCKQYKSWLKQKKKHENTFWENSRIATAKLIPAPQDIQPHINLSMPVLSREKHSKREEIWSSRGTRRWNRFRLRYRRSYGCSSLLTAQDITRLKCARSNQIYYRWSWEQVSLFHFFSNGLDHILLCPRPRTEAMSTSKYRICPHACTEAVLAHEQRLKHRPCTEEAVSSPK